MEIARLFDVNKLTVLRWIKDGLKPIKENSRPLLVMGKELKKFILEKNNADRIKLGPDEFYCLRCRKSVRAKNSDVTIQETGKKIGRGGRMQKLSSGFCEICGLKTCRLL